MRGMCISNSYEPFCELKLAFVETKFPQKVRVRIIKEVCGNFAVKKIRLKITEHYYLLNSVNTCANFGFQFFSRTTKRAFQVAFFLLDYHAGLTSNVHQVFAQEVHKLAIL